MNVNLEIQQSEFYSFFSLYDKLSIIRKRIWQQVCWFVRRHMHAYPSQTKIGEGAGCCRQAVSEAFRLFKSYGWLWLESKGYKKPKELYVPKHLLQIDLINREYFETVRATYRATLVLNKQKLITSHELPTKVDQEKRLLKWNQPTIPVEIPTYLQNRKMSLDAKLKLSMISEEIVLKAEEKMKKKGGRIGNPENYLVQASLKEAQIKGYKLNWRGYYHTLKELRS